MGGNRDQTRGRQQNDDGGDLGGYQQQRRSKTTDSAKEQRQKVFKELIGEFSQREIDNYIK